MGERNPEGAALAAVQAAGVGALAAALIGIAAGTHAAGLLRLMGAGPDVIATGTGYATIMLGGNAAIVLLYLFNAAFRGAGDAAIAMRVLWLANGINLVLDPCLIFGLGPFPEPGVTGAALATTIGRGTAVVARVPTAVRGPGGFACAGRTCALPGGQARVLRLSAAGTLQAFIATASWIGLVRVLSGFGSAALFHRGGWQDVRV
jgi:Na+-driven multidrug efflux pump